MRSLYLVASISILPWILGSSCQPDEAVLLPERRQTVSAEPARELLARFVQVTDTHAMDVESPARFAGGDQIADTAWRAWEGASTQILDGIVRTANRIHASGRPVDFLIHTGDTCDNVQTNELDWFMTVMEGGVVNPLSGPDDRRPQDRPEPRLDPYAPFQAQGLYQQGVHGELPSIPWYALAGNHDSYAIGIFPIITSPCGPRVAPIPLQPWLGVFLPQALNPTANFAYQRVTPAEPGPPELYTWPLPVVPVPERAFFDRDQFVQTILAGRTTPTGHGFGPDLLPWYSVSPVPGLRLIGLFTSDQIDTTPGLPYYQGSISDEQLAWFQSELDASTARGELIIVATHHPSDSLETLYGSAAGPDSFRALLNAYPGVILHLAGHEHRNRVADRGGYLEIETCSTIDWPQEARLIEIWRDTDGSILIGYENFNHVEEDLPPLGDDPLLELRRQAFEQARADAGADTARVLDRAGADSDRRGLVRIR